MDTDVGHKLWRTTSYGQIDRLESCMEQPLHCMSLREILTTNDTP